MANKAFLKKIRNDNLVKIIRTLMKKNSLSRIELANECELAPGTITQLISSLLNTGIVEEYKVGDSCGGRKPVYLRIAPEYGCVTSFEIKHNGLTAAVYNLQGEKREETVLSRQLLKNNGLYKAITAFITNIRSGNTEHPKNIIHIGLLCQEDIQDCDLGVFFATKVSSDVIPLDIALLSKFGIPVRKEWMARFSLDYYVQNEIHARYQNYGYINIGDAITASFTLNKRPVEIDGEVIFDLTPFLSDNILINNLKLVQKRRPNKPRTIVNTAEEEWTKRSRAGLRISAPGIAKIIRGACVFFPLDIVFLGGKTSDTPEITQEISRILNGKPRIRRWEMHRENLMDVFVQKSRDRFIVPLLSGTID